MAHYARQLAAANPGIGDRIKVLHGKVEEVEVPEKVRTVAAVVGWTDFAGLRVVGGFGQLRRQVVHSGAACCMCRSGKCGSDLHAISHDAMLHPCMPGKKQRPPINGMSRPLVTLRHSRQR